MASLSSRWLSLSAPGSRRGARGRRQARDQGRPRADLQRRGGGRSQNWMAYVDDLDRLIEEDIQESLTLDYKSRA